MRKVLKMLGIILGSLVFLSIPAAYLFGSTKHQELKGSTNERVNQFVESFAKDKDFNGSVLVINKGEVILDKSFGLADQKKNIPFKNELQFPIGSLTKSMTAIAILQLEENGKLSVYDKVSKFIPDIPNGDMITIHQLLNHSSGMGDYLNMEDYMNPYPDEKIMKLIRNEPSQADPGGKFAYSNSGYYLLGKIIESVSDMEYATYLEEHIFDVVGMSSTKVISQENKNLEVTGYEEGRKVQNVDPSLLFAVGNVLSTKSDLAKYIQAIDSYQLLSESTTNKMLSKTVKASFAGYGYGWYVVKNILSFDERLYWHGGSLPGLRTGVMRYQDQDLTVIIFSNMGEAWNFVALGNEIASIVFDERLWFFQKLQ